MFSKSKIPEPEQAAKKSAQAQSRPAQSPPGSATMIPGSPQVPTAPAGPAAQLPAKLKPSPSLLASDLTIRGNVTTSGDIQIEGTIEGDVRAHLLTVGETATIHGEVVADDVVVNGRVVGRLRGLKVRLTASSTVEGDIVHKSIAIESGAHFEGSVQRSEDPLGDWAAKPGKSPAGPGGETAGEPWNAAGPEDPRQRLDAPQVAPPMGGEPDEAGPEGAGDGDGDRRTTGTA